MQVNISPQQIQLVEDVVEEVAAAATEAEAMAVAADRTATTSRSHPAPSARYVRNLDMKHQSAGTGMMKMMKKISKTTRQPALQILDMGMTQIGMSIVAHLIISPVNWRR